MMNGSTITMMFLGNKFRVDTDMAMANTSLIGDGKSAIMLMEGMGQRGYQTMPTDQDPDLEQPKVRYTGATKTIAGYATKQVILTNADGTEIELWVAESLQPANSASQFSFEGVKGMPLQMDVEMQGMKVHLTAYEVDTEAPDASLFDMTPPPGFRKMN